MKRTRVLFFKEKVIWQTAPNANDEANNVTLFKWLWLNTPKKKAGMHPKPRTKSKQLNSSNWIYRDNDIYLSVPREDLKILLRARISES